MKKCSQQLLKSSVNINPMEAPHLFNKTSRAWQAWEARKGREGKRCHMQDWPSSLTG